MKILHLAHFLDFGGLETHIIHLCREMERLGHQAFVYAVWIHDRIKYELEEAGIEYLEERPPGQALRNFIKNKGIEILHGHPAAAISLSSALGRKLDIPAVATYHGLYGWAPHCHDSLAKIVCVSQEVRDLLAKEEPFVTDKLVVIQNGINTEVFKPIRPSCDGRSILFMGRLDAEKAVALQNVMEALSVTPHCSLQVAGDGPYLDSLKTVAPPQASFLGYVRDIPQLINNSDIVIGTGRGIREAMACGRPAIALDACGYGGLVEPHSIAALEYDNFSSRHGHPLKPEALVSDLQRLENQNLIRQISVWSRQYAMANYSLRKAALQHLAVYKELLGKKEKCTKTKRPIVCLPAIDWEFLFHRPQQLMLHFAERGYPVHYLNANQVPESKPATVSHNITVYRDFNLLPSDLVNPVYFVYLPAFTDMVPDKPGVFTVYDCIDDDPVFDKDEMRLLNKADLVLCVSRKLMKKHGSSGRPLLFLPNGADVRHYKLENMPIPPELASLQEQAEAVIGFTGAFYHGWVDIELLYHIAAARPGWHILIVGEAYGHNFTGAPANIHYLGKKPYEVLPAYVRQFDIGIIPFLHNRIAVGADPVKLYEYIAAGIPVVCRDLPFAAGLNPPLVYQYSTVHQCINGIEKALTERRNACQDLYFTEFARENTWEQRMQTLISEVSKYTSLE